MCTNKLANMVNKLSPSQLRDTLEGTTLLDDPLGQTLLTKLASAHSPIYVGEFNVEGYPKGLALLRLYQFEKRGLATSALVSRDGRMVRKFHITDLGRKATKGIPPSLFI